MLVMLYSLARCVHLGCRCILIAIYSFDHDLVHVPSCLIMQVSGLASSFVCSSSAMAKNESELNHDAVLSMDVAAVAINLF